MLSRFFSLSLLLLICTFSHAQNKIFSYPFELGATAPLLGQFENIQQKSNIVEHPNSTEFCMALQNNRKVEYILLDSNFKVMKKVVPDENNSLLSKPGSLLGYSGGTVSGKKYNYIYHHQRRFYMETVDFASKTVTNKPLPELPKDENFIISFSDNNIHYVLSSSNKANELIVNIVNDKGETSRKNIPLKVPEVVSRKRAGFAMYLKDCMIIHNDGSTDNKIQSNPVKLYCQKDKFNLVINDAGNPTRIITLSLPDFQSTEKTVDYTDILSDKEKEDAHISSFLRAGQLHSLVSNSKMISIVTHDHQTGKLLNKYEIKSSMDIISLATVPVTSTYRDVLVEAKEVNSAKNLIKEFDVSTNWIEVTENDARQLVVTPYSITYGTSNGMYANYPYYKVTCFQVILDSSTFSIADGDVETKAQRINAYTQKIKYSRATNQFSMWNNQYYGYYNNDTRSYVVEQLEIQ
jgi:hypothetical protein